MLEAMDNLFEFTKGISFDEHKSNKILRFAVIKNLVIIDEVTCLLTKDFRKNILILNEMQLLICGIYNTWLLSNQK